MNDFPIEPLKSGESRFERRDVDTVSIALLVVLLIICGALVDLAVAAVLSVLQRHAVSASTASFHAVTTTQFPAPRLQRSPPDDLRTFRKKEDRILEGYGWIDQKAGVVRIPITRAVDLLVRRGLPKTSDSVTSLEWQQKRPEQNAPRTTIPPGEAPK